VADAGAGRHDAEVVEGALAPAQELVALAVALEFELDVCLEAPWGCRSSSTCTEWSMTRSTGTSGLIFCGSPPRRHRVAHRGQVDHAGTPVKSCISTRAGIVYSCTLLALEESILQTTRAHRVVYPKLLHCFCHLCWASYFTILCKEIA
jgi:hypothetical protein